MGLHRFFISIFSVCTVVAVGMPAAAQVSKDKCARAKNTMDEVACAQEKYDAVSTNLNTVYQNIENLQGDDVRIFFRNAQQQWVAYRDLECQWEASKTSETQSLRRLNELKCLIDVTHDRSVLLESFLDDAHNVDGALPELSVLESPRWLNALADTNPGVFWAYDTRKEIDLNCDSVQEVVLSGIKHKGDDYVPVLAVSENPLTGLPRHAIFEFDVSNDADEQSCPDGFSFRPAVIESINADDMNNGQCDAALIATRGSCGEYLLNWDGQTYRLDAEQDE